MYDYIITKPPLDEDTLAHYGVKGMRWHHRKGSSNRPSSRKRNIKGKGSGAVKKGKVKTAAQIYAERLNSAKTAEERAALLAATANAYYGENAVNKKGSRTEFTDDKRRVDDAGIEKGRQEIKNLIDEEAKRRKKNK